MRDRNKGDGKRGAKMYVPRRQKAKVVVISNSLYLTCTIVLKCSFSQKSANKVKDKRKITLGASPPFGKSTKQQRHPPA